MQLPLWPRKGDRNWTADDRKFHAAVEAEVAAVIALETEIKYQGNPPFVTETQKSVLDKMMENGASLRALAEQQAIFYRENGFEIYA